MSDTDLISIIVAAVLTVIGIFVGKTMERNFLKKEIEDTRKNIRNEVKQAYELPIQVPVHDKRNSAIIVGIGGSGKTSLIRGLLNNKDANPDEKTLEFEIYSGDRYSTKNGSDSTGSRYWFYVADYRGQNIGQLVRSFIVQQKRQFSPLAYGHITSLVLVVDLIPPKDDSDSDELSRQVEPDKNRVDTHLNEWNNTALDAVFGLLTEEIKYVCLYINKIDLISQRSEEDEKNYISMFNPILKKLKDRAKHVNITTYLGSAKEGTCINHLTMDLMEHSVHNNENSPNS